MIRALLAPLEAAQRTNVRALLAPLEAAQRTNVLGVTRRRTRCALFASGKFVSARGRSRART